ncbi:unnamed protein product [Paramecium sonneborni]|uniref:Uncharacterized protein n=1 Tax=Paramecium sonneborni TaxID=65129 RepID=A0A8S1P484_9CILI|nr:unnamed protein product [Paramecium sonneborni]
MNHQGFFGTAIKRNSKHLQMKKVEQSFNNKLFANENLRKIQLPEQLTYQYCFQLDQGVHGIKLQYKSPSKQFKESKNFKQNIENTETLKFSYNQQFLVNDLSPLIKLKRCQPDRVIQNQKNLAFDLQSFDFLTTKRVRAQSIVEERGFSPDYKKKRPQLNSIIYRHLHSDSYRQQENQSENY